MPRESFTYVWSYRVVAERTEEFLRLYGPDGAWARLFARATGYLGTDLYEDLADASRYLSVDRWETEEAFNTFRRRFADEFARLDRDGEELTVEETHLGDFRVV